MLYPKDLELFRMANSYVKDGNIIKYRFCNDNPYHKDSILHNKAESQDRVTIEELEYLELRGKLVVETNSKIEILNFEALDEVEESLAIADDFYYENKNK